MLNTEGWAAGVIMLGQALSKCNSRKNGSILAKSGEKDFLFKLFKYFDMEVLKAVLRPAPAHIG
jgi:hypothetical protein